ncbi:hypothetical protein RclHR1_06810009 [Rhizophagus clarus]|uniref:Uncharacterized protein n=1 Tax=Rhizophagus clarus TaxID=94130 RepID=A0A2Z6SA06_9GLOM|nr:hypothetical protein RclHR1_06810009 [Rhizophagus clarus]GES73187.1 hypothetical protein GLOIN_2v1486650 [Rhizophagus clarus]
MRFARLTTVVTCDGLSNKPCRSNIVIDDIQTTFDAEIENIQVVNVHNTGRTTGHTTGRMFTNLQPGIVTNLFDEEKTVDVLIVTGDNGDSGDSGSPVYDQDGGL